MTVGGHRAAWLEVRFAGKQVRPYGAQPAAPQVPSRRLTLLSFSICRTIPRRSSARDAELLLGMVRLTLLSSTVFAGPSRGGVRRLAPIDSSAESSGEFFPQPALPRAICSRCLLWASSSRWHARHQAEQR